MYNTRPLLSSLQKLGQGLLCLPTMMNSHPTVASQKSASYYLHVVASYTVEAEYPGYPT